MSIHVEVILMAQRHHHGGKPVQSRPVKAAAFSKFKKVLNMSSESDQIKPAPDKLDIRGSKPYGSHNGGTHVGALFSFDAPDGIVSSEDALKVQNICNAFEGFTSLDIKSMKAQHFENRRKLNEKYRDQFGDKLSSQQMTSFKNEYAKLSFTYWAQQVLIKISSTEFLDGATKTKDGKYVLVLKTKTVYTEVMISLEQFRSLKKVAEGTLSTEAKVFTSLTRTGGLFIVDHNNRVKLIPDTGNLVNLADHY